MPETKPQHQLKVLIDPKGHKMAENMFETYIMRESGNHSRGPEFILALDKLLSEFGGEPVPEKEINHNPKSDAETVNNMKGDDDDGDRDIHAEESSVDVVKNAILKFLKS
jgi:hypothetical protein